MRGRTPRLRARFKRDPEEAGHRCWIDVSDIQPGAEWEQRIADAIAAAYAFVVLVSATANARPWVARERRMARRRDRPIYPLRVEDCPLPADLAHIQKLDLFRDYQGALDRLLESLPAPSPASAPALPLAAQHPRDRELAYLRRLELRELQHVDLYTPLAGTAELGGDDKAPLPMLVARPELEHIPFEAAGGGRSQKQTRRFEDITEAFPTADIQRAVLLGPPGAGKTTTLWRLAADLAARAREGMEGPLPLLVKLGDWTEAMPFEDFLAGQVDPLQADLSPLMAERRAVLLLDGLNELPTGAWSHKAGQIKGWLHRIRPQGIPVLATCRQDDYGEDLALRLDTLRIQPLTIERIRDFAERYLTAAQPEDLPAPERARRGAEAAEAFFWAVAGGEAVRRVWDKWQAAGADLELFFSAREIPRDSPDVYSKTLSAGVRQYRRDLWECWANQTRAHDGCWRLPAGRLPLRGAGHGRQPLGVVPERIQPPRAHRHEGRRVAGGARRFLEL
jgi:TIR domain/NACHT domain